MTPLKPHPGHHGGIIALSLLVATTAVVWTTRKPPPPVADEAPRPATSVTRTKPTTMPALELGPRVETTVVGERAFERRVAASGTVTYDESRTAHVYTPVAGWLDKPRATSLGRTIRAGETVAVVYSPEVYLATLDLLAQVRDFRSEEALDKARTRLLRWGMRREMVAAIEASRQPQAALPLIARATGTVVVERGASGQLVEPMGGDLFTITDPAYAWLYIEVPAAEAERARVGMTARVTIDGAAMTVPIGYASRGTIRFDLHAQNIRVATLAEVELSLGIVRGPAIPESAVTRDGARLLVYVPRGRIAEARQVTLGPSKDGFTLVDSGLAVGETIVIGYPPPR